MRPGETILHATTVAVAGRAALIRGQAGRGKSGLALQLIALGAELVADDRTRLWRRGEEVLADAPLPIRGRIEARGVGLMTCPASGPTPVRLIVDMDHDEAERLPPMREEALLGVTLPVTRKAPHTHFPAAIMLYLRYGRRD
ncbi:Hpr(Ser) kinase/phosphatase [Roseovarius halotolerans]|uniref:HPr kinase/phosphorylase n=2 Tax=Roseovarius halotolerans TaxID=505353 RepID=A0A1X6YTC1_9RHOB|nr:serine kinase [Roseovarius halotolerans]RKT32948.1 Hpr(Ser) kinase/phosphatase [Roseovarius halotolerans]SLN30291.1 HPr kinase/phosphorylase [Roseovarius halotolerans]